MPSPMISQEAIRATGVSEIARPTRPAANSRLATVSGGRPPLWSTSLPTRGPVNACSSKAAENARNTPVTDIPTSAAIGLARVAGR